MGHEAVPIPNDRVQEEAARYMSMIQAHQDHPLVKQHFFLVNWLAMGDAEGGGRDHLAFEFRASDRAALIWNDVENEWCAGQWVRLTNPDHSCPLSGLTPEYWQQCLAADTLLGAIRCLEAATPKPFLGIDVRPQVQPDRQADAGSGGWLSKLRGRFRRR